VCRTTDRSLDRSVTGRDPRHSEGRTPDGSPAICSIINTISQDEITQLAKRYLPLEKMIMLVVGDKETTLASLKDLGYPIVELNTEGGPISN
jgi:hypothetical protein